MLSRSGAPTPPRLIFGQLRVDDDLGVIFPPERDGGVLGPPAQRLTRLFHQATFDPVETSSFKIVGQLRKTAWERFARLQRSTAQLAKGRGQPKGVFRFSSNEACDAWTVNLNRRAK